MSRLEVIKKVHFIGSWLEDVVTDDILSNIATRAKIEKGKKMIFKVNEAGVKLTRAKFLQESQQKFIPTGSVQTITKSPEFFRCILVIISDPTKKYKIIALRCETEEDANNLIDIFREIQNRRQSSNIELKKRENGNWTLRGRSDHNSNKHMLEIFNEHKQINGDVVVATNGEVAQVPAINVHEVYVDRSNQHGLIEKEEVVVKKFVKNDVVVEKVAIHETVAKKVVKDDIDAKKVVKDGRRSSSSSDDDDDYVIETEVTTKPHVKTDVYQSYPSGKDVHVITTKPHIQPEVYHAYPSEKEVHVITTTKPHIQPDVYHAYPSEKEVHVITTTKPHIQPEVYHTYPSEREHHVVATKPHVKTEVYHSYPAERDIYLPPTKLTHTTLNDNHDGRDVYISKQHDHAVLPSKPVIYATPSKTPAPSQPIVLRAQPARTYETMVTTSPAGYYTNPWASRQTSRDSTLLPMRVDSGRPKFDQQSVLSHTSKLSRSSRMRGSELSIPISIQRNIEDTYGRPIVVLRRGQDRFVGVRARPASYHHELRVYRTSNGDALLL